MAIVPATMLNSDQSVVILEGLQDLNIDLLQRCILMAETDFAGAAKVLRSTISQR